MKKYNDVYEMKIFDKIHLFHKKAKYWDTCFSKAYQAHPTTSHLARRGASTLKTKTANRNQTGRSEQRQKRNWRTTEPWVQLSRRPSTQWLPVGRYGCGKVIVNKVDCRGPLFPNYGTGPASFRDRWRAILGLPAAHADKVGDNLPISSLRLDFDRGNTRDRAFLRAL